MIETYIKLWGYFGIAFMIYFPFAFFHGIIKDLEEKHKELSKPQQEQNERQVK